MRIVFIAALLVVLVVAGFFWANRPQLIAINAAVAPGFPADDFDHSQFESLLQRFVEASGRVDYASWHQDTHAMADLDTYLAAVVAYSPENAPQRFATRNDALAYWLYGYNAYVIRTVLMNWPLDSVTDIKAPIEAVKGMGFFYRQRFVFGGTAYSLLAVENSMIRKQYKDPRIHFVLNCASESCPVIRPELPTGAKLEALLDTAAREFVADPVNVAIDHETETVWLSAILEMYKDDYLNWLRANGRSIERGLLDYLIAVADSERAAELVEVADYAIRFRDFDWNVNATDAARSDADSIFDNRNY